MGCALLLLRFIGSVVVCDDVYVGATSCMCAYVGCMIVVCFVLFLSGVVVMCGVSDVVVMLVNRIDVACDVCDVGVECVGVCVNVDAGVDVMVGVCVMLSVVVVVVR